MTAEAYMIEGCKQNSRKSQERLYMQAYTALFSLCQRFFDEEQEIITAINNGMLRVFKNIDKYEEGRGELLTWIYTIVRNEALTLVRNKKTAMSLEELTTDMTAEMMTNPFADTVADEVAEYLQKLPQTTRAVCSLFYMEGYDIKETAASLEMKEGTVKWHLSEGRKRLNHIFKQDKQRTANAEGL